MQKIGLVLEGGGLRGAYTAGVLAWLMDHHIDFDFAVGISSGALFASCFVANMRSQLVELAVDYASRKENVGWYPILNEGTPVGYDYLFETVINQKLKLDASKVRQAKTKMEFGLYDLAQQSTFWLTNKDCDDRWLFIKAACTLPIAGRSVTIKGKKYLDGGLTSMIPIERSQENGCRKHFVVTTKDISFVRKPNSKPLQFLLDLIYLRYPKMLKDFRKRTDVYYRQRHEVASLVEEGNAMHIYPSKNLGVKRFKGDKDQLQALFDLGYADCEAQRGQIIDFVERR